MHFCVFHFSFQVTIVLGRQVVLKLWFVNHTYLSEFPGGLVNMDIPGSHSRTPNLAFLELSLVNCMVNSPLNDLYEL